MENKKPLLSICIPTYNRAEYLDKCLMSIVSQGGFNSDDVELVISDNASDDNTEEVVRKYQRQYRNIFYSKNNQNVGNENHPMVISNARGAFRKLCNDTLIFREGAVEYLLNSVKKNIHERPVLFFMNHLERKPEEIFIASSLDSFVKAVSFQMTWIGGFGIWEDDFNKIEDKYADCELSLWHTKILLGIIAEKKTGIIDNNALFLIQDVQKKDLSYGLYQVFYVNYFNLYQPYLDMKILSKDTFTYLKKHILFFFFMSWIVNFHFEKKKYQTSAREEAFDRLIFNAYCKEKYYGLFYLKLQLIIIKRIIGKIVKKIFS